MNALRVGVIGLGVGAEHAAAYTAHPACELVVLCDLDPDKLAAAGADHPGARLTRDAAEILDDPAIDVVSVASYDDRHFEQVRRALEAGKHVFAEKPLCQTEDQARRLHDLLSGRPRLRLSSNLPLRLSPRFIELKRLVDEGRFGRLFYVEGDYDYGRLWKLTEGWRGDLDNYSVVLGGTVHLADLLLWITGDRAVRVSAAGNRIAAEGTKFAHHDLVVSIVEFESGMLGKFSANFGCVHPHYHGVKVFGREATFVNGMPNGTLYEKNGEGVASRPVTAAYPGAPKGGLIAPFVDSIVSDRPPAVTSDEVFGAMALCLAMDRAVAEGRPVEPTRFG
jgi:predicted dehydrogenase